MKYLLILFIIFSLFVSTVPNSYAENVPDWVKNTAGWWADDSISELEFVNAIEFLINDGIIQVSESNTTNNSQRVTDWVKNTAGWWADDSISELEFVNAIEFLIKIGIIQVSSSDYVENQEDVPDWLINNPSWIAARITTDTNFENFNTEYFKEQVSRCENCIVTTNQYGFRGENIVKEKLDNVYRIFAVGGSTTHGGTLVNDDETWPAFLQQILDKIETEKEFQVINAGIMAAHSDRELNFIKNKIIHFEPDMIIMYDGWNDSLHLPTNDTVENWKSVCRLGNEHNFESIIIIQPILSSGN